MEDALADAGPVAPVETRAAPPPFPKVVRSVLRSLAVALLGVAGLLGGMVWDAVVHARDPEVAHTEGSLFSLSTPAHAVLVAGGALATLGLTLAMVRALALSGGRRLSSPRTGALLVVVVSLAVAATVGAARWASTAQVPLASGPLAPAHPEAPSDSHGIGIVNAHASGPCRPTAAERAGAAKLVRDTEIATARYRSFDAALADGYVGPTNPTLTEHYAKAAYTQDGRVLDPARPEALMYTPTGRGMVLVGVMFLTNVPGEFGPEPGGCLTRWHVHNNVCFSMATFEIATILEKPDDTCPSGQFRLVPPPALHVWLLDVPGGRFAPEVDAEFLKRTLGP